MLLFKSLCKSLDRGRELHRKIDSGNERERGFWFVKKVTFERAYKILVELSRKPDLNIKKVRTNCQCGIFYLIII